MATTSLSSLPVSTPLPSASLTVLPEIWLPSSIPWVPCFSARGQDFNVTFQCANLTVPMDYLHDTQNKTTQVGIAMAHAIELDNPLGLLFVGQASGESAILSIDTEYETLPTALNVSNRMYDVLLVDPRGVGWSNYLSCTDGTDNSGVESNFTPLIQANDSESSIAQQIDFWISFQNCNDADHEYLAHMNTPILARDLDLIRNLTGHQTLDYIGFDEGTMVGVTYAALFPDRVGKMVIDAPPNFGLYMGITGNYLDYRYNVAVDLPVVLNRFASQCVAAAQISPSSCPLAAASMHKPDPAGDILARINTIFNTLTKHSYGIDPHNPNEPMSIYYVSNRFRDLLGGGAPFYGAAASLLLEAERVITGQTSSPNSLKFGNWPNGVNTNLTTASYSALGPPPYSENGLLYPAVSYADASLQNMDTKSDFIEYISAQIAQNPLIAYPSISEGICLGWPNLTAYNVENYRAPFPKSILNKMLIVSETNSYSKTFSTYQYIGGDNAVVLIHDGAGEGIFTDPNNCTYGAITEFFVTGTLPANGTRCTTDHSGPNNIFLLYPASDTNVSNDRHKLVIGLVLGLGFPLIVGGIIGVGLWHLWKKGQNPYFRSRERKDAIVRLDKLKNNGTVTK